jgi:hypothetical protein
VEIRSEVQQSAIADEVSALVAVVRPILQGILLSLKREVVDDHGGHANIKLRTLARVSEPVTATQVSASNTRCTMPLAAAMRL